MLTVLGNSILNIFDIPYLQNNYLKALAIIAVFYVLSRIIAFIIKKYVLRLAKKTKTGLDDAIIKRGYKPFIYLLFFFGVKIAVTTLSLNEKIMGVIQHLLDSFIIIIVMYAIMAIIDVILDVWGKRWAERTNSSLDDDLLPLLHKASKIIFVILGLIFVLQEWNVDITGLLAGVGIVGLALGFAVKDSLTNIFGGIQIILDKTYKVGDIIKLDSGDMGRVTDIGLRSTRIKTWDNELLIVPNGTLANSRIQNYKLPDLSARIVIDFGVVYGSNVDKVKETVMNTIKKNTKVIHDDEEKAPRVMFMQMGECSLEFKAFFWVPDISVKFSTKEEMTCAIYNALNKSKIGIPFPTRTVYMKKEKD